MITVRVPAVSWHNVFMPKSNSPYRNPTVRFFNSVTYEPNSGCWLWLSNINGGGYGRMYDGRGVQAHRFSFELHKHPIPEGGEIDHTCRNRLCVNPSHLEIVDRAENARRKALAHKFCKHGHELTGSNKYVDRRGWVTCVICRNAATARHARGTSGPSNSTKTECLKGHEFTPENTITDKLGRRLCRQCRRDREGAVFKSPINRIKPL